MFKKLQKSDCVFIIALVAALALHLAGLLTPLPYNDEFLYLTGPYRFINGDVMMIHEWHFTQFSSLFSHLPVLAWLKLNGSTEGIMIFLRIIYLSIHTVAATGIYSFFRKYKLWAVAAAIIFYTQTPYRMLAISYVSMIVLFLLFFTLCLYAIHKKERTILYIIAGICFGACCVCNPLYCFVYPAYVILCVITSKKYRANDTYNKFFSAKPICLFTCGICIIAVICVIYFFVSGGTFSALPEGLQNIFTATEYGSVVEKFNKTSDIFGKISLRMQFLLPALFILLAVDKNRKKTRHRTVYLILALVISAIYAIGIISVFLTKEENGFFLTLPLFVFSLVCYILTKNKNKAMFYCIWCPCVAGAVFQYLAANTIFTALSITLAVSNVAGVFFICDLFKEISNNKKDGESSAKMKNQTAVCSIAICVAFCIQLVFNGFSLLYERVPDKEEYTRVSNGPLSHFYLDEVYFESYTNSLSDLDIIKSRTEKTNPVLIISRLGWMHLYIERPFAAYSASLLTLDTDLLTAYYEQNPQKKPKYIYVGFADFNYIPDREKALEKADKLEEMFDCTREELSAGLLLTVN